MPNPRIALYVGNEVYPSAGSDPSGTIKTLQQSPLTSPILGLLNQSASNPSELVFNDATNPLYNTTGDYIGSSQWPTLLKSLRNGGDVQELYLSFSTNGTEFMSSLITSNPTAAHNILFHIKSTLGFDGIDLDYEGGNFKPGAPIFVLAEAAVKVGLKLTAAPYNHQSDWQVWVKDVQSKGGTVAWLNLQCYAGGKYNNPGDWLNMGTSIVAGTCNDCCCPQTNCTPTDMQNLFTLWRTGQGSASGSCWGGRPNSQPQAIGGGFIWVYSSIKGPDFFNYMNAVKVGLGMEAPHAVKG
ncbi:MAG: hypothetical protein AAGG75_19980 [Bacteroidota bacterium]